MLTSNKTVESDRKESFDSFEKVGPGTWPHFTENQSFGGLAAKSSLHPARSGPRGGGLARRVGRRPSRQRRSTVPPRRRREGAAPSAPLNCISPISVAEPSPRAKFTSRAGRGPPGRPAGRLTGTPTEHVELERSQTRDGVRRACCEQAAR